MYQAHTHTIAEIDDLGQMLDNLGSRVQTLESIVGITGGTSAAPAGTSPQITAQWTLPTLAEVYPLRTQPPAFTSIGAIDLTKLPRAGGLYAAVHSATVDALPMPLPQPAAGFIGRVFQNQTGATVVLNGALKHRSFNLLPNQFAACDGRAWYGVDHFGTETSYYPTDFDRELFVIAVNDKQLRTTTKLSLQFSVQLAVLGSNTNAQWVLVIEHAAISSDTSPATTGVNLKNLECLECEVPILSQPIILTSDPVVHTFGCTIARNISRDQWSGRGHAHHYGGAVWGPASRCRSSDGELCAASPLDPLRHRGFPNRSAWFRGHDGFGREHLWHVVLAGLISTCSGFGPSHHSNQSITHRHGCSRH